MLAKICMTLSPKDIISTVESDAKIKGHFKGQENFGLKYSNCFFMLCFDLTI